MLRDVVASMRIGLDTSAADSFESRTTATTEERYDPTPGAARLFDVTLQLPN
jgi:hypothetical protein